MYSHRWIQYIRKAFIIIVCCVLACVYVCGTCAAGFPGVQIGSHINEWNLDAPELLPVFAASISFHQSLHFLKSRGSKPC